MGIFGIGGSLFNPINLASLGLGPAGWASMAARMVVANAAQAAINYVAQQSGPPASAVSELTSRASDAFGVQLGQQQNLQQLARSILRDGRVSFTEAARLERGIEDTYKAVFVSVKKAAESATEEASGLSKGRGKSWIRALVEIMGKRLDSLARQMEGLGKEIDSGAKKSGELQAVSTEFNLLQNALNTIVKTVAEGQANLARRN